MANDPSSSCDKYGDKKSRDVEAGDTSVLSPEATSYADPIAIESSASEGVNQAQILGFAAFFWSQFLDGWNDGTSGPLLPVIQRHYHVSYPNFYIFV